MNGKSAWTSAMCSLGLVAFLAATGCGAKEPNPAKGNVPTQTGKGVREPAVAGLFYPREEAALSGMIDSLLASAPERRMPRLRALVCPHAGYRYSGATAATAYKLLAGSDFQTVILLAPSHYALVRGASVSGAAEFKTPLGNVPVSERAAELARKPPFLPEAPCPVQRPDWSGRSSRSMPTDGSDTPDTWEHSDEVQVPFLQKTLKKFKLLPVVMGEVDPLRAAEVLAPIIDDKTLLVASSDLSHYHPYEVAKTLDARCVAAITNLNMEQMRAEEACGKTPIMTIMALARMKGWIATLLDHRNSGDSTGDKTGGVVGYAAVAFSESPKPDQAAAPASDAYTKEEKKYLMELARKTVAEVVSTGRLPEVDEKSVPSRLKEKKGCFVTLTKKGELRGCIGHILPQEPLYLAVRDNARSAAIHDSRFPTVEANELPDLAFEISVLTEPRPLGFNSPEDLLNKLQPQKDGVVLNLFGRTSTFLPQVWEQLPDKVDFLNRLSMKAGGAPSDWRKKGVSVSIYHVEAFKESEL